MEDTRLSFYYYFRPAHRVLYITGPSYIYSGVSPEMIIIGIDPGLARLGYGVLEVNRGEIRVICYGCIETSGKDLCTSKRLVKIYNEIGSLFEKYPPAHLSLEKLFFARNITSALRVSEVRGIILLAAELRDIPVTEYTPNQIKQAITGSGRADKRQMQEMIRRLLRLSEIPTPDDAADALSIALCHIHIMR
jgi:crossover junction endodeoxyribonuclease RuvC